QELLTADRINSTFPNQTAQETEERDGRFTRDWDQFKREGLDAYLRSRIYSGPENIAADYTNAKIYAYLGEREKALDSLDRSVNGKAFIVPFANAEPAFDSIRSSPRFHAIMQKMNFGD